MKEERGEGAKEGRGGRQRTREGEGAKGIYHHKAIYGY